MLCGLIVEEKSTRENSKFNLLLVKQHHFNICWQYFNIATGGKFFGAGFVATEIKAKYPGDFLVAK